MRKAALGIIVALGCSLAACGSTRTVVREQRVVTVEKTSTQPPSTTSQPTPSLTALMSRVQSGIVRIESETCDGTDIGTGFELSPRVVATVEHVVDGASTIAIKQNGQVVAHGSIIGADPDQDLALLLTDQPLHGATLRLADRQPELGESVAAIGFPLGLPLSVTQGTVSGLNRTIPIDGYDRQNLIQTDAAVNPGNSGGPLLSLKTGEVVGLVDLRTDMENGLGFAVSSRAALTEFAGWRTKPQPVHAVSCSSTPAAIPAAASPPYFSLPGNSGNTGNTGNTGDTGSTGNTGNTGNTGTPPSNTGNTGTPPSNTGNTGTPPSNTGNTGATTSNSGPGPATDQNSGATGGGNTGAG